MTSCSALQELSGATAVGTAAQARAWLGLEQSGPWGRKAATQSHLDPDLGHALDARAQEIGARFALLRSTGFHPDSDAGERVVQACGGLSDSSAGWLVQWTVTDPATLLDLDWQLLLEPTPDALLDTVPDAAVVSEPVVWVCTNGKRDVCCAVRGRPAAAEAAAALPGRVWETTHTGGHRFAPTGVVLPGGQTLAFLSAALCVDVVTALARGQVATSALDPHHDRGRSCLPPEQQAAEHAVRLAENILDIDALTLQTLHDGCVRVTHRDGRTWQVDVTREESPDRRPASCGAEPRPTHFWTTTVTNSGE